MIISIDNCQWLYHQQLILIIIYPLVTIFLYRLMDLIFVLKILTVKFRWSYYHIDRIWIVSVIWKKIKEVHEDLIDIDLWCDYFT